MFTFVPSPRRPRSATLGEPERSRRTAKAERTERRITAAAVALFAKRGYERTTLRAIARRAGVSLGLVYRYFPSKGALVLEFYDELSLEFESRTTELPEGSWTTRCLFVLEASRAVLAPYRDVVRALAGTALASSGDLLIPGDGPAQARVQDRFIEAVTGARDCPADAERLGRSLYLIHLAVVLAWLVDRSPDQTATDRALALVERLAPFAAFALGSPHFAGMAAEIFDVMELGVRGRLPQEVAAGGNP